MIVLGVLFTLFFVIGVPIFAIRANVKIGDLQRDIDDLRAAVSRLQKRIYEPAPTTSAVPPTIPFVAPEPPKAVAPVRPPEPLPPEPIVASISPSREIEGMIAAAAAKDAPAETGHLDSPSEAIPRTGGAQSGGVRGAAAGEGGRFSDRDAVRAAAAEAEAQS